MLVAGQMGNHRLLFEVYKGRTWLISESLDEEGDQLKEQIFWRVTRDKPQSKRKKKVGWMITIGPNPWMDRPWRPQDPQFLPCASFKTTIYSSICFVCHGKCDSHINLMMIEVNDKLSIRHPGIINYRACAGPQHRLSAHTSTTATTAIQPRV